LMRLCILGLGYVGTTSMACLAELGHEVYGVDVNADKVDFVNAGRSPILEPGVSDLLAKHHDAGRVRAGTGALEGLENADAALVCVGTPSMPQGTIDVSHIDRVIREIAEARRKLDRTVPVVVRSTALPANHRDLMALIDGIVGATQPTAYCAHPEYLRAGQAIDDFMNPPVIVFGCTDDTAVGACDGLYPRFQAPVIHTDPMTAAFAKYAANGFHPLKVTFANEIGLLCRAMGIDSREVLDIVCRDTTLNISTKYLAPGFAFGGSCLPKDLRAIMAWGRQNMVSTPMLEHVLASNDHQVDAVLGRIIDRAPKTVGLFGLSFKADTDDLRESPLVSLAEQLSGKGCTVRVFDPTLSVHRMVGANLNFALNALPHLAEMLVEDPETVVEASDVVVIARDFSDVEWPTLPWHSRLHVIDLCGDMDLSALPMPVEGLYWRHHLEGTG
jgi:GDP-mannose 6-dehydrogenase